MPEDVKPTTGDNAEKPTTDKPATPATDTAEDKSPKTFDEEYVKGLRNENKEWRTKFREVEKQLSELSNAKQQETDKKLAEDQKWQELATKREKELADLQAKHATERMQLLRSSIAARYASRLPQAEGDTDPVAEFAKRLQGSTEEEIKADAEALIALLRPAQPEPQQPAAETQPTGQQARRQTTAVAPDGQPTGETADQKRDRLYGRKPISDPPIFRKQQS